MEFVGRVTELQLLEKLASEKVSHFIHVRGRRRIGKTSLLKNFAEAGHAFYFSGYDDESDLNCRRRIASEWERFRPSSALVTLSDAYLTWDRIFSEFAASAQSSNDKPFILIFDEIQWLAKKGSGILGKIKETWESEWSRLNNFKLLIAGSSAKFFLSHVDNKKGVLFGLRTSADIQLQGFNPRELKEDFFQEYLLSEEQICLIKMMTGGVPYYLNQIARGLVTEKGNFFRAVNKAFFCSDSIFLDEVDSLFSMEFRAGVTTDNVRSIVRAVGQDGTSETNIVKKTGLPDSTVNGLVAKLLDYKLLTEHFPFGDSGETNNSRRLRRLDPFTDFYFQCLEPKYQQITENTREGMLFTADIIFGDKGYYIPNFSGKAFELLLYNFFRSREDPEASIYSDLSLKGKSYQTGTYWKDKVTQIDLILESKEDRETRIIEAKWINQKADSSSPYIDQLKNKKYRSPNGYKQSRYLIASRGYSEALTASLPPGIEVLDLETLFDLSTN